MSLKQLDRVPIRRALISVYDKTGLEELAQGLHQAGVRIVSTGSTAKKISAAGIPVTEVSEVTGFQECLDGRVKTLHPLVHAGILADRRREDHPLLVGDRDSRALVSNMDEGHSARAFERNRDRGPFGRVADGVADQIDENLDDRPFLAVGRQRFIAGDHALESADYPVVTSRGEERIMQAVQYTTFGEQPELLDGLFNRGNQADGRQQQALAGSVAAFAGYLVNKPTELPDHLLSRIAHKHVSLGLHPAQYQIVHHHLKWAIVDVLGDAVTPEDVRAREPAVSPRSLELSGWSDGAACGSRLRANWRHRPASRRSTESSSSICTTSAG